MGSLHQVLHDPTKKLDSSFQYSFALDVIKVCVCVCMCVCVCVCARQKAELLLCIPPLYRGSMLFILVSLVPMAT